MEVVIKHLAFLFLLIIISVPVYAGNTGIKNEDIVFDVLRDYSVIQVSRLRFEEPVNEPFEIKLRHKARIIEVTGDNVTLDYSVVDGGGGIRIKVFPKGMTSQITIRQVASDLVFRGKQVNHFFAEISPEAKHTRAQVRLPSGHGIYKDMFIPTDAKVSSDGKQIVLLWDEADSQLPLFLSVKFSKLDQNRNYWVFASVVSFFTFSGAFVFSVIHFRKKSKEAFLKGFREDERKTINFLESNKVSFQNKLQSEFKFSRAKATRIIMKLEEKGIVRKERCGRTNKVFWIVKGFL
ncbi:hypothetical protein HYU11_03195 [Candidatus Woesearchaeota archaeon]|nr:hypothetical protein [Candidatus Woesearchaeota archaeon]